METQNQPQALQEQPAPAEGSMAPTNAATTPAAVLDLNPTGFVDDLYNTVELHCATAFDELDSALRTELQQYLTPEQLTILFQGTAGLYQDLRVEVKRQMQSFEEYALEEILKVPAGLMADVPEGDNAEVPEVAPEEETAVDEQIKALRREIAAAKSRTREMRAASSELDCLIESTRSRLEKLETVPAALAGKENFVKAMAEKGSAVEAGCLALEARYKGEGSGAAGAEAAITVDGTAVEQLSGKFHVAVEREILRKQAVVKSAPAADLKAIRENIGV